MKSSTNESSPLRILTTENKMRLSTQLPFLTFYLYRLSKFSYVKFGIFVDEKKFEVLTFSPFILKLMRPALSFLLFSKLSLNFSEAPSKLS